MLKPYQAIVEPLRSSFQLSASKNNPIINPAFTVWNIASPVVSPVTQTHTAEGWLWESTGGGAVTISRSTATIPTSDTGGVPPSALHVDVTTADATIAAAEIYTITHRIEGNRIAPLLQRPFSLGFWVRSSLIGTYCVSFRNSTGDRHYVAEYTIHQANTWEWKTIQVAASPSAGTWNYETGIGLRINFILASGTDFHTTPNAWTAGNLLATANQVNLMGNTVNEWLLYGPILVPGRSVPYFMARSYAEEVSLTQRYWESSYPLGTAPGTVVSEGHHAGVVSAAIAASTAGALYSPVGPKFSTIKRAVPTVQVFSTSTGTANAVLVVGSVDRTGVTCATGGVHNGWGNLNVDNTSATAIAAGATLVMHWTANARL